MDYRDQDDLNQGDVEQNLAQDQNFADDFSGSQPQVLPIGQDVVTLPPGTSLASLEVQGRDLIIVLDDGSRIVVPDGAVFVPQIVVEGVTVPPLNVAQLLNENTPEPAAGATQSSGGNFADDEGAIQDAFDLGDLLPFTNFGFPEDREEEIIPNALDREVELVIQTPNEPAGAQDATAGVDEAGLPARTNPAEPEGTDEPATSETTTGTIVFNAPDGVDTVTINGVPVTGVGQAISTPNGTLTITSIDLDTGQIGYSYNLDDNTLGDGNTDVFTVVVTDNDGDQATATLTIDIADDGPIAADDLGQVEAGSHAPITGDVLANDVPGADGYATDGAVSSFGNDSGTAEPGESIQGEYGVLTINPDGTYTYVRDPNTPGGVEESFTYTIVDQDGSTSTATLVIEIGDAPDAFTDVPRTGDGTVVDESGLPARGTEPPGTGEIADNDGGNDSDSSETTGSSISFSSPDGVASITINGVAIDPNNLPQTIVSDANGTLVITGYTYDPISGDGSITYEFTLGDNTLGDDTSFDFDLVITDLDGDAANDTLTITVVDDEPEADDDSGSQGAEDAPITVDVFANDTPGADDVQSGEVAFVDGSLSGDGSVAYNNDGTFTYTPAPGEEGTVTFDYTITDGDGDVSTATVTIELLDDSEPEISVGDGAQVDEAGLPARGLEPEGSDEASDSEIVSGAIAINTGNDTVASLVINGVDVTSGGTVSTAKGDLVVSVSGGDYSYTYTLKDNTLTDPESDIFSLTVTDSDGDTASTTLVIAIADDAPDASDDANAIGAGEYGPVGGNVLGNDTQGADGAGVTSYTGTGGSGNAGAVVQGTYGTLTIAADGTYFYTRDPGTPGGVSDTFDYTITDGDGDTASAQLVISIADAPTSLDLPTAGEDGTQVLEDGLDGPPAGSAAASNNEFTSGTFTYAAPDGPATVTIGGVAVTSVGQTFVGSHGTLTIDAISAGSISYTYELATSTSGDNTSDSFVVRVTDQDGDFSEDSLEIAIVDDVPSANPDSDSVTKDGPVIADGNVLTGSGGADANATDGVADVEGADGATVTGVAFGATNGTVGSALVGAYGQLTLNADGSYSYELDNQNGIVQGLDGNDTLQEEFTYSITDVDGDTATTTLTIIINGNDDPVVLNGFNVEGPEVTVYEGDLADGSSPNAGALTQPGSFTVDSPDGLASLTVGGVTVFDANTTTIYPVTIDDPTYGKLTIIGVTPVTDSSGDVVSATIDYSYVLEDNSLLHTGGNDGSFTDSFAVVATDSDGSTDTDSLDITVVDDLPSANPDLDSVTEDGPLTASGNVITDAEANGDNGADTPGADGATVTGVIFGTSTSDVSGSVGSSVAGSYGSLVIAADGSYTYTLDNANPLVQGLDSTESLQETFTYTTTDVDGDTATTTVTITINGAGDPITLGGLDIGPAELTVDEDDLADGSSPDNAALTQTGSFTIDSQNGLAEVKAGGLSVWTDTGGFVPGQTITTAIGTFVITGVTPTTTDGNGDVTAATVTFSYVLDDNTLTHTAGGEDTILESFGIEVTDTDGSTDTGSVDVLVIDDVPDVAASQANAPTLVTDDTDIGGKGPSTDTGNFAGLFTTQFGADGPAASDSAIYSLAINGGDGTDSGLDDALSGDNILLRLNGDTIEGYLENSPTTIAFTLELNPATGDITQTQNRAVVHDDPNDSAETQASGAAETLAANLVSLTVTVTDGDGDMDSESIDIGGSFAFEDDGPGLRAVVVGIPLDEDDLVPDGNGDAALGDDFGTSLRTFTYDVDFGADGPNADEITASFLTAEGSDPSIGSLALTSGGAAVIFDWDPATNTLTGYTTDINDPVLTMQFDLVAGTMTLDYLKPIDHPSTDGDGANDGPEAGYEDNIVLNFEVVITDGDGDTATFPLSLNIDDDMAVALADSAMQQTENQSFTIDALDNDALGADGVDTTDAAKVFVSGQASQGTVTYDTGTGLFTYTPDAGAGSNGNTTDNFEYTIIDGDGDASTATVTVTLQPDSEPLGGYASATVDDDGLPGNNLLSTTGDLDANVGDDPGDTSEASFTGALTFSVGNDTPASITFAATLDGSTATVGQETVTYSVAGNVLTATITGGARDGTDLFTVEITDNATGEYVVTLLDNVLHDAGNDENDASASIDFIVADSEGDTALTNLSIVFDDDAPTATDEASQDVNEGATATGTLDFVAGADGASVTHIGSTALVFGTDGFSQSIDIGGGSIKVKADGSYEFTADNPTVSPAPPTSANFTVTDGDGDTVTATVNFQVVDTNVPTGGNSVATVDDDGLIDGNSNSTIGDLDANVGDLETASEAIFQGVLTLNFGGDGPGSVGFAVMDGLTAAVGQETVTYSWNAGSNTLTATGPRGILFTVEVTNPATGDFTVTLVDNVLHAQGPNDENDALANLTYTVVDTDGSTATGNLAITFDDDAPTATDENPWMVTEDTTTNPSGNVITDGPADSVGADGATVTAISIDGTAHVVPQDGNTLSVSTAKGTYTMDMSGNWSFDPNPNQDHTSGDIDSGFSYTLTDGDGDTDVGQVGILVSDGTDPSAGPDIDLALDDQNLVDGSTPAVDDFDSDSIVFTPGSDNIASIVFGGTTALGGGLTWVRVSDTQITGSDGTTLIVTLDLSVVGTTATVTATLNNNYDDHPTIDLDDLVDLGDVDVIATDIDGDTASATVSVSVSDDLPTVTAAAPSADTLVVDETDFAADAAADFSTLFTPDYNADNPGTLGGYALGINAGATGIADTATGQAVVLVLNGGVVEGRTATSNDLVFTISVNTAGVVELDQIRAVEHPVSGDDSSGEHNDPVGFSAANLVTLTATVTDSDGDTDSATVNIAGAMTFRDDGPGIDAAVTDGNTVMLVTQDAETDGDPTDSDTATSTANFGGAFTVASFDYGADDAGSIAWAFNLVVNNAVSGLSSDGNAINLYLISGEVVGSTAATAGAVTTANTIFSIAVNATSGEVTLTQFAEIDHPLPGATSNYDSQLAELADGLVSLEGTATITDKDGDTDSETVSLDLGGNVKFSDDGPELSNIALGSSVDVDETDGMPTSDTSAASILSFTSAFGADGDGGTAFTLTVADANSGLATANGDHAITLVQTSATVITGEFNDGTGTQTAFTVTINANGTVTLTQNVPLEHLVDGDDTSGEHNDTLDLTGKINATVTITDGDGDTDSETVAIGSGLTFYDDGPDASVDGTATLDMLVLDESADDGSDPDGDNGAPEGTATTTATFADNFSTPIDYGTDGPGSVAYGLVLSANGIGSGLYALGAGGAQGAEILLTQTGDTITGSVGSTDYFTITVNPANGEVTFTQLENVWHDNTASDDETATLTLDGAGESLLIEQTVTDADGDTDAASIELGAGVFKIEDDGPELSNVALGSSVDVDETDGMPTSDTSAASILSFTSAFGADGDGGTAFTLTVADANSGLATADGDHAITLVQTSATVITGEFNDGTGTQTAFTVTINANGTVTLTQDVPLEHLIDGDDTSGEHNDTLDLTGKINATVTITDGDGDTDSETVAIGSGLTFYDDGPSVTLSGTNPDLQVSDADLATDASLAFAGAFTFDGGEDGAASTAYALSATDGSASGIFDTATGNQVFLFLESGVVVGREGTDAIAAASGNVVFTVTVTASGTVELDQQRAVDHSLSNLDGANATLLADNLVQLTATITDNDGDTDSASLDIGSDLLFADDTPTAEPTETAFLDDDTQGGNAGGPDDQSPDTDNLTGTLVDPTEGFGNDGGTVAFATTGAPTGFQYVASGSDILIQQDQGSGFITVVTVTLDPNTGNYTVTQNTNILHADDGNNDENEQSFTLSAILTDGDGDTDTTSLTITVDDDTPIENTGTSSGTVDEEGLAGGIAGGTGDVAGAATTATGSIAGFFTAGADAPLTYSLSTNTTGLPALESDGTAVTYSVSGNTLTATAGTTTVFTIVLDPNTGVWTFTLLAPVDHVDGNDENDVTVEFGGMVVATDADGDEISSTLSSASVLIDDDTPVANDVTATPILDDDAQAGGNAGGTGDVADNNTVTGAAGTLFAAGADGAQSIAVTGPTMTAIYVDTNGDATQEAVTWTSVTNIDGSVTVTGSSTNIASVAVLTVNPDGSYSYTQNAPVVSSTPGMPGSEETDSFVFSVTVTDNDNDSDTSNLTIQINDDTPIANNDANALSEDTATVGGNILTDGTADAFGADGAGSPAITAITGFGGAGSVGGSTTGEWGSLTLGTDGTYTYTLNTAAVQGLDDGETETDTFTYTIQDGDGDTTTATLTITINGANDAPVANADTNWTIEDAAAAITGDVLSNVPHPGAPSGTFADVADTDVDVEPLTVTTTGTFNGTYGILTLNSDGTYSYSLYTQAQNATAYAAVQALSPGDTPLTDNFNYTASDGDLSDNSTLTISIFGANDAPVVGTATVATSDEGMAIGLPDTSGNPTDTTNLATASGTVSITDADDTVFTVTMSLPTESLAVTDGSTTGAPITWSLSVDGKTLTGTINAGTQTAITVVIDDTGAFDVTQHLPIFHPDTTSEDVLEFTVDVNVNDGTTTTTQTDAITVELEDDSPVAVVADDMTATNVAGTTAVADLDSDDDVDNNFGGDDGKVIFTAATITSLEAQGLTSSFVPLEYSISADGTVLTAVKEGTTDTVFTITLDPATNQDQYVLNLVQEVDSTSTIDFNDGGYNFVGGNLSWTGFVPLGETLGGTPVDNDSPDLLLTPEVGGVDDSSVNTTANIGGIAGGASVGSSEVFRVDFVTDLRGDTADTVGGQDYAALANRDHDFDGHYTVNGATALFKSTSGSQVRFTAFDDPDGNTIVGDGVIDTITGITISYKGVAHGSVIVPTSTPTSYTVNGQTFTVTLNADGSVSIDGIEGDPGSSLQGTVVGIFTADGFNSVEYAYESGGTFQVGDFGATAITNDPFTFEVPISVTDLDGDIISSDDLDITLNPTAPPVILDMDGNGVQFAGLDQGIAYDYDGDGVKTETAWVLAGDGILVFDADNNNTVSGASEFVFGGGGLTDLEAIAAKYDDNGDGVLNASDSAFAQFGVWLDYDQDAVADPGEFITLSDAGIVSINLISNDNQRSEADGDVFVFGDASFTRTDGSIGLVVDTAFGTGDDVDEATTSSSSSEGTQSTQNLADERVAISEVNAAPVPANDWQNDSRSTGFASVASMSGALLLSEARMSEFTSPWLFEQSDLLGSDQLVIDPTMSDYLVRSAPVGASNADLFGVEAQTPPQGGSDHNLGRDSLLDQLEFGSSVTQDEADQRVDAIEIGMDAQAPIANAPAMFASDLGGMQAMDALLAMQEDDQATDAKGDAEFETAAVLVADLVNEQLIEDVIDALDPLAVDLIDYLENDSLGSAEGLLEQAIYSTPTIQQAVQLHDQQLDDAALAATQA